MSKMSDGGKGSGRRPNDVDDKKIEDNWNNIFGMSPLERKKREEALQKLAEANKELGLEY
jgi:hypothetical protein